MPSPHIFNAKFNLSALACKVGCMPNGTMGCMLHCAVWPSLSITFFFFAGTCVFFPSYKIRLFLILLWFWNSVGSVKYKLCMECWAELNSTNFLFAICVETHHSIQSISEFHIGYLLWLDRGQGGGGASSPIFIAISDKHK